jgi:hypothetical protein
LQNHRFASGNGAEDVRDRRPFAERVRRTHDNALSARNALARRKAEVVLSERTDLLNVNAHPQATAAVHALLGIELEGVRVIRREGTRRRALNKSAAQRLDFLGLGKYRKIQETV